MARHISHGADVEQLDDIAVGLRRQSERLSEVGGRGAVLLEVLRAKWEGPDFEEFARSWRSAHRAIDAAEGSLRGASRLLAEESDAQRGASGVPSGGGSGGSGGSGGGGGGAVGDDGSGGARRRDDGQGPMAFFPTGTSLSDRHHFVVCPRADGNSEVQLEVHGEPIRISPPDLPLVGCDLVPYLPTDEGESLELADLEPPAFERLDLTTGPPEGTAFERVDGPAEHPYGAFERSDAAQAVPEPATTSGAPAASTQVDPAPAQPETSAAPAPADGGAASAPTTSGETAVPAQLATDEGAHVTTASDSAGQRSVAFNPFLDVLSGGSGVDGSQMGGWLGIDDLDLQPWNR
ncbi:WXG100 family type VII secretion target [Janibacter sp. RAF20_2_2]|uniref:WXG100 family type VII secretion target n=1 Tax=unclassified Janibacter TaxID=2649294 RepID=UPI003F91C3A8